MAYVNTRARKEKSIEISNHARQRLEERAPWINKNDYKGVVKAARYKGLGEFQIHKQYPEFAAWFSKHYLKEISTNEVKLYKNLVFVFVNRKGRSRLLKTVMDIPESQLKKII